MKPHSDTACFTTRLSSDLADQAKLIAKAKNKSLNKLISEALKKEVDAETMALAIEGYAAMAEESVREVEEWMPAICEVVESDGGY